MGLRLCIGNGLNTLIWGDAWLLSEGSGKVITSRPVSSSYPNTVHDLIDWEKVSWAMERIEHFFWPRDVSRILEVPIGTPESADCSYWVLSQNGSFTVRSAYHHILQHASNRPVPSCMDSYVLSPSEWKWLWGLSLPLKSEYLYRGRLMIFFRSELL